VNQDGLKLNVTIQLLVYADDVNMLGASIRTIKKNTADLFVGSNEIGLEVVADKTMHIVTSRDQNARRNNNMNCENSSFERVEQFKYLEANLTNQNSIPDEIKSRLKSGNACCHSVKNHLSFSLLSKNLNIKIHKTIVLPVVCY